MIEKLKFNHCLIEKLNFNHYLTEKLKFNNYLIKKLKYYLVKRPFLLPIFSKDPTQQKRWTHQTLNDIKTKGSNTFINVQTN